MAATDLTGGVAVRTSALCLSADGSLGTFSLWDDAARGALLLDLALAGRLESLEDSIVVDAEPTGFPPADALLAAGSQTGLSQADESRVPRLEHRRSLARAG